MKKAYLLFILEIVFLSSLIFAVPSVTIQNWNTNFVLNNIQCVLFSPTDSPEFSSPDYDDSAWKVISFPLKAKDYSLFIQSESAIQWYRIHIKLPSYYPAKTLGINLGKISDVDQVWWNDIMIAQTGDIENSKSHACNKLRQYEIPSTVLIPGQDNVLSIRVRNTWRADELPGRGSFYIGAYDTIRSAFFKAGVRDLIFPIVYFVFFAYFLLLYSKRIRQKENLLYSLFSFCFAIYSLCRTDIKYEFFSDFNILQKFEFVSMYFSIPLLMAFALVYYNEKQKIYHIIYYIFSGFCILLVIILQDHLHWYNFNVYFVQITWIFPFFIFFKTLAKNYNKTIDARIMLGTFVIVCAGILHDIAISRGYKVFSFIEFWLTPFAMFIYVGGIAIILSVRFANSMNEIEELNATLEQKVEERTAQLDKSLQEIKVRDEKIQCELVMAGSVQQTLLPEVLPKWPVQTAVRYKPLREVSGDFYNFARTPDAGYVMYIGDVSGHGMPAALYSILAFKAFKEAISKENNPGAIISYVNDELCKLQTGQYLTSFFVKYDGKGSIQFINFGHPRAILLSRSTKKIIMLDTNGTVIGIQEGIHKSAKRSSIFVQKGDCIIMYTDCLVERTNTYGEQYGESRLQETIKKYFYENLDNLIDLILEDFLEFAKDAENKDDLTIVGMQIN